MQKTEIFFAQDFYEQYLSTINSIHFTHREMDVIACFLDTSRTKKMALFLSIKPRAVDSHIRNIMYKIKCSTRENIIDFIDLYDKLHLLKNYYFLLKQEMLFTKDLKDIAKLTKDKTSPCCLIQEKGKDSFVLKLKSHLELVGITVSINTREKKGGCTLFILPQMAVGAMPASFLKKVMKSQNNILLLLRENKNSQGLPKELLKYDFVDFVKQETYFSSFFLLLEKLLPNVIINKSIDEFKEKYKKTSAYHPPSQPNLKRTFQGGFYNLKWRDRYLIVSICALIVFIVGGGFSIYFLAQKTPGTTTFRSDLVIPVETAFLNRPELIKKINDAFKLREGIETVAIVGIGGAGKTTLARQYAHQQKASLVWEINAETTESLKESFANLAFTLSGADEDKILLRDLEEIKDSSKRERKIVEFVKERIRLHSNWFLIYDNVENYADIQKYFPLDHATWGQGKVILTTRDGNIQNNQYVNHTIQIGELDEVQKLDLFSKIMNQGEKNSFTSDQRVKAKKFLENIPPFPLDVSVAAYYLKTTNTPYPKYLEHLSHQNRDFSAVQENFLQEAGEYTKTRYSIITLTISQLIKGNKDFIDLLLFISLLDSQNIPRDLLSAYKNEVIVENFTHHLKKYSLITNVISSPSDSFFSIHRSTQTLSLLYLKQILKLDENNRQIKEITTVLETYIDNLINKEDSLKMKFVVGHYKAYLTHNFFSKTVKKNLSGYLGCIYFYLGDYKNSINYLETSLLEIDINKNDYRSAQFLLYLGMLNRELGNYEKVKNLLNKSYRIYQHYSSEYPLKVAQVLGQLGHFYDDYGEYKNSKSLLEKSLVICREHFAANPISVARISRYLGMVNLRLGYYDEAETLFKQSLNIYRENFSENDIGVSWSLLQLGNIHRVLGEYKKAKIILENCYKNNKKMYSKDHPAVLWSLFFLGNLYTELGEYKKAKSFYFQALSGHRNLYGNNNIKTSWVLAKLGYVDSKLGNFRNAKAFLEHSLKLHKEKLKEDHLHTAWILFALGDVYRKLYDYENAKITLRESLAIYEKHCRNDHIEIARVLASLGDTLRATKQFQEAKTFLEKSLSIYRKYFPSDHMEVQWAKDRLTQVNLYLRELGRAEKEVIAKE